MKVTAALLVVFSWVLAHASVAAEKAEETYADDGDKTWNLIFIMTDDQGAWSLGSYGNKEAITPNLDRLAAQGARFTNAFSASPVCSPSRVTFLTGLYPTQSGFPFIEDVAKDGRPANGLPPGVPTWPRELKKHGYKTGLIGKWHLGRTMQHHPHHYGIDYFFGFLRGGNHPIDPWLFRNGSSSGEQFKGPLPDILTDDAMEFVERHRAEPFALMLHFRAPHVPYGPVPEEDEAPFRELDPTLSPLQQSRELDFTYVKGGAKPWPAAREQHDGYVKRRLRAYYASVHSVDRNVGRLMDHLKAQGVDDRTIVIFTSDQGYMVGHRGFQGKGASQPIRGSMFRGKLRSSNMWDLGIRVPFIVRWPGVAAPGTVVNELVSSVDAPVSILRMLNVPTPENWPRNGKDMTPLLKGETATGRSAVFGALDLVQSSFDGEFTRMIRTKRWKLVKRYFAPGQAAGALYDLENDPDELRNLYLPQRSANAYSDHSADWSNVEFKHPEADIRDDLEQRLLKWRESIDDPLLAAEQSYLDGIAAAENIWSQEE